MRFPFVGSSSNGSYFICIFVYRSFKSNIMGTIKIESSFPILPENDYLDSIGITDAYFQRPPQQVFKNHTVVLGEHGYDEINCCWSILENKEEEVISIYENQDYHIRNYKAMYQNCTHSEALDYILFLIGRRQEKLLALRSNLCNLFFSEN